MHFVADRLWRLCFPLCRPISLYQEGDFRTQPRDHFCFAYWEKAEYSGFSFEYSCQAIRPSLTVCLKLVCKSVLFDQIQLFCINLCETFGRMDSCHVTTKNICCATLGWLNIYLTKFQIWCLNLLCIPSN